MSNELNINGTIYVPKDSVTFDLSSYSIIRCKNAGVHFGIVKELGPTTVKVENSRRLWAWWSKATLSELAIEGPLQNKLSEQKYARVLPHLTLITSDVCEVIACSTLAAKAIIDVPVWEAAK